MAIWPCWILDWAQGLGAGLLHGTKHCRGSPGHNWFFATGLHHGNRPTIHVVLNMVGGIIQRE
jgi:hypothetical protein